MPSRHRNLRPLTFAVAMTLCAIAASPQSSGPLKVVEHYDYGGAMLAPDAAHSVPTRHQFMARLGTLDERIQMLVSDMKMFVGELKIAAMADLLTQW